MPRFLEFETYRFRAHSMYDPDKYREKGEVAAWKHRDPIEFFCARLKLEGHLDEARLKALEEGVARTVEPNGSRAI